MPKNHCDIFEDCDGEDSLDCFSRAQPTLKQCQSCLCSMCQKAKCPLRQNQKGEN